MPDINGVTRSGIEPLGQLVGEAGADGEARWAAIAALAHSSDPSAYDALASLADVADWTVRRAAVEALGQHAGGRGAEGLLRVRLHDASPYVVRAACDAAAALGLTALRREALILLHAQEAATRIAALRAVGALWADENAAAVLHVHRADRHTDVRREAAYVLRRRVGPARWPELVALWRGDPLARHRVWAFEFAAESGDAALCEAIKPLAADPDGHVHAAANRALTMRALTMRALTMRALTIASIPRPPNET